MVGPPGRRARRCSRGGCPGILPPPVLRRGAGDHADPQRRRARRRPARRPSGPSGRRTTRSRRRAWSAAARRPGPGEITLAHRGVLFLDELAEFSRAALEALRQPLEERQGRDRARPAVGRASRRAAMLVAACNACPCGARPASCRCTRASSRAATRGASAGRCWTASTWSARSSPRRGRAGGRRRGPAGGRRPSVRARVVAARERQRARLAGTARPLQRRDGRPRSPGGIVPARRRSAAASLLGLEPGARSAGAATTGCCGWRARSPTSPGATRVAPADVDEALGYRLVAVERWRHERVERACPRLPAAQPARSAAWRRASPGCSAAPPDNAATRALLGARRRGADRRVVPGRARRGASACSRELRRRRGARRRWTSRRRRRCAATHEPYPAALRGRRDPPPVLCSARRPAPARAALARRPVVDRRRHAPASPYGLEMATSSAAASRRRRHRGQRPGARDRRRRPPRARSTAGGRPSPCSRRPRRALPAHEHRACTSGMAEHGRGRVRAAARPARRSAGAFPARNRIMAAARRGDGGGRGRRAVGLADHRATSPRDLGRDVGAVPGPGHRRGSPRARNGAPARRRRGGPRRRGRARRAASASGGCRPGEPPCRPRPPRRRARPGRPARCSRRSRRSRASTAIGRRAGLAASEVRGALGPAGGRRPGAPRRARRATVRRARRDERGRFLSSLA